MSMFQFDLAMIFHFAAFGVALLLFYKAAKEPPPALLKAAGVMFLLGGLSAVCTFYWGFKYYFQGEFDHPGPAACCHMHAPCPMMQHGMAPGGAMPGGMMPGGMMDDGMMSRGMMMDGMKPAEGTGSAPPAASSPADSAAHDAHHPGARN